jgi:hypothetical protein
MMGINAQHLRRYVIVPTLDHLAAWNPRIKSEAAIRLLLMTAAHESRMGHWLHQVGGPAEGIYQMEPATHYDLLDWIGPFTDDGSVCLKTLVTQLRTDLLNDQVEGNLYYATAMARLFYWRRPEPLPEEHDLGGLARYAKQWWNTYLGKATVADYLQAAHDWEIA